MRIDFSENDPAESASIPVGEASYPADPYILLKFDAACGWKVGGAWVAKGGDWAYDGGMPWPATSQNIRHFQICIYWDG